MEVVGDRHWTHGPVVLGSKKLHAALAASFTDADARPLRRLKKTAGVTTLRGELVVVLASNEETGWVAWNGAVVLVHGHETKGYLLEPDRVKAMATLDPRTVPAKDWKAAGTITLAANPVLFDAYSRDVGAKERRTSVPVKLAAGDYVVELATGEVTVKPWPSKVMAMRYTFVRLRPPTWTQPAVVDAKAVVDDGPVIASPDVITRANKLALATCDGIPMVVAPKKHLAAWTGIGADGTSPDYDRACNVGGLGALKIGGGQGLVISEPGGMLFWPARDGGLIVIWYGADSAAGCVAAALSIPDDEYEKQKVKLVVAKGAEDLILFESAAPGSTLTRQGRIGPEGEMTASFRLRAGTYAIDAVWNYEAAVKVGKKIEDTMIGVLRLRRR